MAANASPLRASLSGEMTSRGRHVFQYGSTSTCLVNCCFHTVVLVPEN